MQSLFTITYGKNTLSNTQTGFLTNNSLRRTYQATLAPQARCLAP
jgi:hypothetical protein